MFGVRSDVCRDDTQFVDRLIIAKDHASVQITIADVDEEGKITSTGTSFALCGQVRANGESDDSINRLATNAGCEPLQPFYLWHEYLWPQLCSIEECLVLSEMIEALLPVLSIPCSPPCCNL